MTEREFAEGVDISTNPRLLLDRSVEQLEELEAAIQIWADEARPRVETEISGDLSELRTVVRMDKEAPTQRWSMLLGEAVHTMREALDALAWDLVHVDGAQPSNANHVYFPIVSTSKDWRSRKPALLSMPPEALERIHKIQPIALGAGLRNHVLWNINNFDVDKKHRGKLIAGRIDWGEGNLGSGKWVVESLEAVRPEMATDPKLEDGFLLVRVRFQPPAQELPAVEPVPLPLTFVVGQGRETMDLGSLMKGLPITMNQYFEFITTGKPPA